MAALKEHHVPTSIENHFLLVAAIRIPYQVGGSRGATTSALLCCGSAKEAVAQAQEAATDERGRLTIGSIGPLVHAFLPDALAKFREHFPLVEVTVLNMDDRTQVEALANGTIMLGIGWAGPNLAESQSLTAKPLLRCSFALACAVHRWPATRGKPKLSDFREDNFLAISTETGSNFVHLLRTVCQRDGGFEPNFLTVGNSLESLLSMVAAGRGVLLGPQILFRQRELPHFRRREGEV